ncbi:MAG: S8 family serine peptidase [Cyanobacteria bacterium P01_A01_bin.123]
MAIYIVRPEEASSVHPLSFDSIGLDPTSRRKQVERIIQLNREEPHQVELQAWLSEAKQEHRLEVIKGPMDPSVTGASILDLPEDEVEKIQKDLTGLKIVRDQPIRLISPESAAIYPNSLKTRNPRYTEQVDESHLWHLREIGYDTLRLHRNSQFGADVTVAVIDTGIDSRHEDFRNTTISAYEFDGESLNFNRQKYSRDTHKHGTHIAGLICGSKTGIAKNASLLSCVVLPRGKGSLVRLIRALDHVCTKPEVSIVNVSAGIEIEDDGGALEDIVASVAASGVLLVSAVGNDGASTIKSPAIYPEVLSVGATDKKNKVAGFSGGGTYTLDNHGRCEIPSLVAPGFEIFSCVPNGNYEAETGTSMATAIVSGIAALILGENPQLQLDELKEMLCSRCKSLDNQARQGSGLVQAW